jgi:hypothetical protein
VCWFTAAPSIYASAAMFWCKYKLHIMLCTSFLQTGNFNMGFSEAGVMLNCVMLRLNYIWQLFVQINNTKFYNGCLVDSEMKYSCGGKYITFLCHVHSIALCKMYVRKLEYRCVSEFRTTVRGLHFWVQAHYWKTIW